MSTFDASLHSSFDAIRSAQHLPCNVYLPTRQQLSNLARTDSLTTKLNFRNFVSDKPQFFSNPLQQFDIAFPVMSESEPLSQIDLNSMKTIFDYISQEVCCRYHRELSRKSHNYGLFDSEHTKAFDFLIEGLE